MFYFIIFITKIYWYLFYLFFVCLYDNNIFEKKKKLKE